ncbi:MAG: hypothetical protein KKD86_14020 [Bacteroidetes bacterium]|nr:hypothetical protein [Bacteroidota bacterium]
MLKLKFIKNWALAITALLVFPILLNAQHRGDNIDFQGLSDLNDAGVKATAMGSAVTSLSGDISSLFYNPAGLASIKEIKVSATANYYSNSWWENQHYRPNRLFVTLPFYLEGLYIPDPADDGKLDVDRLWTPDNFIDSNYVINLPDLGKDPFGKDAADWKRDVKGFAFNNFAAAVPLEILDQNFVFSAGFSSKINIQNFDQNNTYLDPHPGYFEYGEIGRVNGNDTLIVNWSRYLRQREGSVYSVVGGIGYELNKMFSFGLGVNYMWGSSDDYQYLDRVGTFDLLDDNDFRFSYADNYQEIKGASNYNALNINFGFQVKLKKFQFGAKVDLPYTLERSFSFTETFKDTANNTSTEKSGMDQFKIPAVYNFGVSFYPVENFLLALDYEYAPFSKGSYSIESSGEPNRKWSDRHTLKFGMEYSPFDFISLLAGYRNIPTTFIPDGTADKKSGPKADSYTFGLSIDTFFGRFDASYEYRILNYYDSYFSNTNYVTETYTNVMVGFVYSL